MNKEQIMTLTLSDHLATKGTIIRCVIDIVNNQNNANFYKDMILSYMLPEHMSFVEDSVTIDGIPFKGSDIVTGIRISEIPLDTQIQVSFDIKIVRDISATLLIAIKGEYFVYIKGQGWIREEVYTNGEEISILRIKVDRTQSISRMPFWGGELITYHIVLKNTGDVPLYHMIFSDHLAPDVNFQSESFEIEGKHINGINLKKGIFIGSLMVNESRTLSYQVKDIGNKWIRNIQNNSLVMYTYQLHNGILENGVQVFEDKELQNISNQVKPITNYKEIEKVFEIGESNPAIQGINQITGTVDILDYYEIETVVESGASLVKGYKLVVRGNVNVFIDYTTEDKTQSTYMVHTSIPFSTFILLPLDHRLNTKINLKGTVIFSHSKILEEKKVLINLLTKLQLKSIKFD